tara:strand:+ start:251 stop:883 length:633 start_codon:yes stop_codon:yes gene_type:complete
VVAKEINKKGILAKLIGQGVRILLIKECKNISNIKIDIISSSSQIIKGEIQKINIIAEDINYKDLLFDKIDLETNRLKINFKLTTKELYFENDPIIKVKISLSQNSLKKVLLSSNWNFIGNIISKKLLNQDKLEDIKINNGQFIIKVFEDKNTTYKEEQIEVEAFNGRIYLKNKTNNKLFQIPIEEKIYIENVNIKNDLINISANSSVTF